MIKFKKYITGFGLIEILVGAAIIVGLVGGGASVLAHLSRVAQSTWRESKAVWWLEEGAEAMRLFRDVSWSNIAGLNHRTVY